MDPLYSLFVENKRPTENMKCPGCSAIMLITEFRWIDEKANWYHFKEVCSVCRVIHEVSMKMKGPQKI